MESTTVLNLPQDRETPVQVGRNAGFVWRYAYARSIEAAATGEPGQDFLAIRHDADRFAFALCDGVSQSFYGDLAARFLGERLVDWLWSDLPPAADVASVRAGLAAHLRALTTPATERVAAQALPAALAPLLREVLDAKRAAGSESTFVCGRLDLPRPDQPAGRVVLAWMGDTRLRLWGPAGERTPELGATFQTAQRWSSCRGPVAGEPNLLVAPIERGGRRLLQRMMTYSDGLSELDTLTGSPTDAGLTGLIATSRLATSDDVSLLEVRLVEPSPAGGRRWLR